MTVNKKFQQYIDLVCSESSEVKREMDDFFSCLSQEIKNKLSIGKKFSKKSKYLQYSFHIYSGSMDFKYENEKERVFIGVTPLTKHELKTLKTMENNTFNKSGPYLDVQLLSFITYNKIMNKETEYALSLIRKQNTYKLVVYKWQIDLKKEKKKVLSSRQINPRELFGQIEKEDKER